MATIPRSGPARINSNPTRSYISMRAYHNDIFNYTVSRTDFVYSGSLGPVTGANAATCPQGRILVESGKKLYPGANPGITSYMVKVFDYATGLSGFVDPNSTAFTPQNTDRPYYITSPGRNSVDPHPDRAPPVFTRGDVLAQGNFDLSGNMMVYGDSTINGNTNMDGTLDVDGAVDISGAATIRSGNLTIVSPNSINVQGGNVNVTGNVIATKQLRSSTMTTYNSISGNIPIDVSLGQVFKIIFTGPGQAYTISATNVSGATGAVIYVILSNASGGNIDFDFNSPFYTENNGDYNTIPNGQVNTFSYVCDGSGLYQIGSAARAIGI